MEIVSYKLAKAITQQWQVSLKRELPKDMLRMVLQRIESGAR